MFTYGQVTVIDDFIDKDYQEKIKIELLGGFDSNKKHHDSDFPWFYIEDVTAAGDDDSQHRPGLGHQYVEFDDQSPGYVVSEYHELFKPLLQKVGLKVGIRNVQVLQGRSFLQFPLNLKDKTVDTPHTDLQQEHLVALYYVCDSDGHTVIYNERYEPANKVYTVKQKVKPKQGRMVLFDGSLYHTAEQPEHNVRCVVNYNLG